MMNRCRHAMLAGLCVVPGCTHAEKTDGRKKRSDSIARCRPMKQCDRCRLRRPLEKDGTAMHCADCREELRAFRENRGKGGFDGRVRNRKRKARSEGVVT